MSGSGPDTTPGVYGPQTYAQFMAEWEAEEMERYSSPLLKAAGPPTWVAASPMFVLARSHRRPAMAPDLDPAAVYEQRVHERADLILAEYQGGAYPEAMPEHARGECVECDALRLLADRDLWEREDA